MQESPYSPYRMLKELYIHYYSNIMQEPISLSTLTGDTLYICGNLFGDQSKFTPIVSSGESIKVTLDL